MFSAEDARRKEAVESQNLADSAIYSGEKFLQENGDKISEAQQASIQTEIDAVKAVADGNADVVQPAVTRLQQALQEVGTAMYQQQQETSGDGNGASADGEEEPTDEDVVEGEFSEE